MTDAQEAFRLATEAERAEMESALPSLAVTPDRRPRTALAAWRLAEGLWIFLYPYVEHTP